MPPFEHPWNDLRVVGVVFEMQDAQRDDAAAPSMLPGGGSLMTAQKMPSSLIALTNSWKSTGFTT